MVKEKLTREDLIQDFLMIVESVEWLGRETEKVIAQLEKEERNQSYYNEDKINGLVAQIETLIKKLHQEDKNINKMLKKYPELQKYCKLTKT